MYVSADALLMLAGFAVVIIWMQLIMSADPFKYWRIIMQQYSGYRPEVKQPELSQLARQNSGAFGVACRLVTEGKTLSDFNDTMGDAWQPSILGSLWAEAERVTPMPPGRKVHVEPDPKVHETWLVRLPDQPAGQLSKATVVRISDLTVTLNYPPQYSVYFERLQVKFVERLDS